MLPLPVGNVIYKPTALFLDPKEASSNFLLNDVMWKTAKNNLPIPYGLEKKFVNAILKRNVAKQLIVKSVSAVQYFLKNEFFFF